MQTSEAVMVPEPLSASKKSVSTIQAKISHGFGSQEQDPDYDFFHSNTGQTEDFTQSAINIVKIE